MAGNEWPRNVYIDLCDMYMLDLTSDFNEIAIRARAQMAADKEAVGLSRVHMYESK